MYPIKKYKNRLWCNIQVSRLVLPLYFLSLGIGLTGQMYAAPFYLGVLAVIYFLGEIKFYVKHREIRDDCLRYLIYENKYFMSNIKKLIFVTISLAAIANVFFIFEMKITGGWVLLFSVLYFLLLYKRFERIYE